MKKTLPAIFLTLSLTLTGCHMAQPENEHVDYSMKDSRELAKRSVVIDHLSFSIVSYSMIYSEYQDVKPSGKGYYLVIDVSVYNTSSSSQTYDLNDSTVITKNGDSNPYQLYGGAPDGRIDKVTIPPNAAETVKFVYQMPAGTTPDFLIIKDDEVIDILDPKVRNAKD